MKDIEKTWLIKKFDHHQHLTEAEIVKEYSDVF